jgi:hypothetical protein
MGDAEEAKVCTLAGSVRGTVLTQNLSVIQMHANIVLAQDVLDYAALFGEIADAYYELEMYADAGPIYETLGAHHMLPFGCIFL